MNVSHAIVVTLLTLLLRDFLPARVNESNDKIYSSSSHVLWEDDPVFSDAGAIFRDIEKGIKTGKVNKFSEYFNSEIFLSVQGVSGYRSANQAFYILKNYFDARHTVSFKLSSTEMSNPNPYATGGGTARFHGRTELFQVFVSLSKADGRWVISQFNVY